MPILMDVAELQPGMCLAANIMNRYSVLLPHGRRLNEADIAALNKKLPDQCVHVIDPLLDDVVEFEDDSRDREISFEVRRNVANVTHKVSSLVRSGVALDATQLAGLEKVVDEMMRYLQENPVTTAIIEQANGWNDYLQEHSADVFYLSLLIGNTIKNYIKTERERMTAATVVSQAMNLTPLATAALFHDMGMAPIEYIYHKAEPLTREDTAAVRNHPITGADMLPDKIDPMVRLVIRCHHENFDGTGYPQGLPGKETNIFTRIIRVADAYSAAIAQKVYRRGLTPIQAVHQMLYTNYQKFYDPVVLKVFASIMQPLPIGAKLKLHDNRCAIIVRHNRSDCFNPEVIIAFDEWGDPLTKEELERPFYLRDNGHINVVAFGEEDISFINGLDPERIDLAGQEPPVRGESSGGELFEFAYP